MIFHYREPVLFLWIWIGFEAILESLSVINAEKILHFMDVLCLKDRSTYQVISKEDFYNLAVYLLLAAGQINRVALLLKITILQLPITWILDQIFMYSNNFYSQLAKTMLLDERRDQYIKSILAIKIVNWRQFFPILYLHVIVQMSINHFEYLEFKKIVFWMLFLDFVYFQAKTLN